MAVTGMTAAIYAALTVLLPIPAYGPIQCRLSEVMNLLAFVNPAFAPGIILGCFIANLFSTVNPVLDCIVGTAATALSMLFIVKFSKNLLIASLWPTLYNGVLVGAMIFFTAGIPLTLINFLSMMFSVMVGEFLAMTVAGYCLFRLLMRNEKLVAYLKEI